MTKKSLLCASAPFNDDVTLFVFVAVRLGQPVLESQSTEPADSKVQPTLELPDIHVLATAETVSGAANSERGAQSRKNQAPLQLRSGPGPVPQSARGRHHQIRVLHLRQHVQMAQKPQQTLERKAHNRDAAAARRTGRRQTAQRGRPAAHHFELESELEKRANTTEQRAQSIPALS